MAVNLFDASLYRAANSDLATFNNAQALSHFQKYGLKEGRAFSPFVDLNFYRSSNSDLGRFSYYQLFDHLQNYGLKEGRNFSPLVDVNFYRTNNNDLAKFSNEQIFEHLRNWGVVEGRSFSPFVDLNVYRAANPDLNAGGFDKRQLFEHLANYGVAEGRRFSVSFNSNYYRNANSDLASLNNSQLLEHFEHYGLNEGRASSESFNVKYYLERNSDLKALGFNYQQAEQHFEMYGFREGRLAVFHGSLPSTDPGNNLNTAFSLDFLSRNRTISEFVGSTDRNDYYRFTLTSASNLNLSLSLSGSSSYAFANMQLIFDTNNNGQVDDGETLNSGYGSSYDNTSTTSPLGAGSYFIRIYTDYSNYNTNYTLGIAATPIPTTTFRDPGNTLNDAVDIGTVRSSSSIKEFVGSADQNDYYRFTLASASNLNLTLSLGGSSSYAFANMRLIFDSNNNGQVDYSETLNSGYGSSYNNASISSPLGAGSYFIRIYTDYGNYNTNYTLGIAATPIPTTTVRDPGSTLDDAVDIGTVRSSSSIKEFVGSTDRNDYYRFTLASASNLNASLYGLSDGANVELIFDRNSNGQVDYNETLDSDYGSSYYSGAINRTLGAGTYFFRVYTSSSENTSYTLNLSATAATSTLPKDPGNTLNTAYNLGFLSGIRSFTQFVGNTDSNDYYRFSLSSTSNFNLSLDGLSMDADVQLIRDGINNLVVYSNEIIASSSQSGTTKDAISLRLNPGTYYIRVYPLGSSDTSYTLTLSV